MLIEAVTVCVGYADFLAVTAVENAGAFDRWIIVTSARDHETREVCRRHNLQAVISEDHTRGPTGDPKDIAPFNKGRLVERGLQHTAAAAWRLHLDADIVLPPTFKRLLGGAHLDPRSIYGCDRVLIRNWEQWQRFRSSAWWLSGHPSLVAPPRGADVGARWMTPDGGYAPCGFFQLWHSDEDERYGARVKPYPISHGDACRADIQHALQWDRRHRQLLPELYVAHLESQGAPMGANWAGRTTPRFGPGPANQSHGSARAASG